MTEYLNNASLEKTISRFQMCKREKIRYMFIIDDLQAAKDRVAIRKGEPLKYISNLLDSKKSEYDDILLGYDNSQKDLANAFLTLSQHLANYKNFQYIDIDDAVQEGVLICFEKIDRFDPEIGAAFNYMTTCILNHFRQLYRSARHYNDLKGRYLEHIKEKVYGALLKSQRNVRYKKISQDN